MPELTPENIERISRDVRKQEITYSHLADELIDHICCDVEYEMEAGLNFPEAYWKVRQKIGPRRLKEIQEETLYAVDTKYRHMKNIMKISGTAGAILFGFAALFKIEHWPGAGLMMTLGSILLALIFMPSSLGVLWKETKSSKRIILFVSTFFTTGFFIFGTLFKVQHWSGAGILLGLSAIFGLLLFTPSLLVSELSDQERRNKRAAYITGVAGSILFAAGLFLKIQHWAGSALCMIIGIIIVGLIAFPLYVWIEWKDEARISSKFIFIIIGSIAIILPGAMMNLSLQHSYEAGFFPHQDQEQALYKYLAGHNKSVLSQYRDSACFQLMEQLHSKTDGLLSSIGNIQTKMVQESEGNPGRPATAEKQIRETEYGPEIQYGLLTRAFSTEPVNDFLLRGSVQRQDLEKALKDYVGFISALTPGMEIPNQISKMDLTSFLYEKDSHDSPVPLISGLHSLELLKNSILIVESRVQAIIANY
ncbi:MAG: hypothetical protein Q8868_14120 [Bacteroidota bacterium]|nr:hypothetical protein [Bacteroidota bacterium]